MRDWVYNDFGIDLESLDEIGHGADAAARLWCGTVVDGSRYAVKLSGGGSAAGLTVTAHLAGLGVPGVPAPVPTAGNRLFSSRDGCRLSLVPWVSDRRAIRGGMTEAHWKAFGVLLAQVHSAPAIGDLPVEDHTHERVKAVALDVTERASSPFDPLSEVLARDWPASADRVMAVVDRADQLGERLRGRKASNVVCHADPHLGNLLLGDDGQVWLIDWDDAILAPRERDLMFVLHGVLALAPATDQASFFAGYGPVDLDPDRLTYYRCVRALEDTADPAAQVLDPDRWTDEERADALSILQGQLSPEGLVNLALARADC